MNDNIKNVDNSASEEKEKLVCENSRALHIPAQVYLKIVETSFEEGHPDILTLERSIDTADYDSIKKIAHRLKGVYSNLKLEDVSTPAQSIDELAKSEGDIAKIKEDYIQLKNAFEGLVKIFS